MSRTRGYSPPPLSLLDAPRNTLCVSERDLLASARLVERGCRALSLPGSVTQIHPGPVVSSYDFVRAGTPTRMRLPALVDEIRPALGIESVRIERAPGGSTLRFQIPNRAACPTSMVELLSSEEYRRCPGRLPLPLGRTATGDPLVVDLAGLPHLLVAGSARRRVDAFVRALVTSLLFRVSPDEVGLLLLDSGAGGLRGFDGIPHLLHGVVSEPATALAALRWAVRELEARYSDLAAVSVRNILEYNRRPERRPSATPEAQEGGRRRLPRVVIVIGELAGVVPAARHEVEDGLARLAQMSRAVGIHVIIATAHPTADIVTGFLKANFPVRVAFRMPSRAASQTILDAHEAVQLLDRWDMLHRTPAGRLVRVHPPEVTAREAARVASHLRGPGPSVRGVSVPLDLSPPESAISPARQRDRRERADR
jgi:S-DNA-T family DNA segregation ATPase FtsK/SpoIIIE